MTVEQHDLAESLFKSGRHNDAANIYKNLADGGSVDAQLFLGWMYQNGFGVEQNHNRAFELYRKATNAGSLEAEFYLGSLYELEGIYDEAIQWLQSAAEKNYTPAIYRLGKLYEADCTKTSMNKAMEYFQDAAKKGHLIAQKDIALKMMKGQLGWSKIGRGFSMLLKTIIAMYRVLKEDPYNESIRR